MKDSIDPTLVNGWLFPGTRVSYNNCPFINLNLQNSICHYSSPANDSKGSIDKRQSWYIVFNNDANLKWYYQEESTLKKDKDIIKLLISNSLKNKKDSI